MNSMSCPKHKRPYDNDGTCGAGDFVHRRISPIPTISNRNLQRKCESCRTKFFIPQNGNICINCMDASQFGVAMELENEGCEIHQGMQVDESFCADCKYSDSDLGELYLVKKLIVQETFPAKPINFYCPFCSELLAKETNYSAHEEYCIFFNLNVVDYYMKLMDLHDDFSGRQWKTIRNQYLINKDNELAKLEFQKKRDTEIAFSKNLRQKNEFFTPGVIILLVIAGFSGLIAIMMGISDGGQSSYSGGGGYSTQSVPTQETLCKNLKYDLNNYESRINQIRKDFNERNASIAKSDPSYGEALQEVPGLSSIWSDEQLWIKYKSEYKLILQENSYKAKDDEISSYLNNIIEALSARIKFTQMQPSPEKGDLSDKLIGLDRDSFRAQSEINKICGSPLFPG